MLKKFFERRSLVSSWLLLFFTLILVLGAAISEFFQAPTITSHSLKKYTLLMDATKLKQTSKLSINNHLGEYRMEYQDKQWQLTSPRVLPANLKMIEAIKKALSEIVIQKILPKDPINISNFSLKKPMLALTLSYGDEDLQTISFGLKNSIDNTTYVTLSNKDAIFHVTIPPISFEALALGDFIDSNIFPIPLEQLTSITIYKGDKKHNIRRLKLVKKDQIWTDRNGREQNQEKVVKYLQKIFSIKSEIILDRIDEKLQQKLDRYLKVPAYTVSLEATNDFEADYFISNIIGTLPGVKLEKWQNFVVTASNRTHPYLVNKKQHYHFAKTQRPFKSIPIKKLFY